MLFITNEKAIDMDLPLQSIYFYANWMPFHHKFITMISKIEERHKDIKFLAIDVDHFASQCKRFSITSIPTVVILKNGREIKRVEGLILTSAFKNVFVNLNKEKVK